MNARFAVTWKGSKVQVKWGAAPDADTYVIYAQNGCGKKVKVVVK